MNDVIGIEDIKMDEMFVAMKNVKMGDAVICKDQEWQVVAKGINMSVFEDSPNRHVITLLPNDSTKFMGNIVNVYLSELNDIMKRVD